MKQIILLTLSILLIAFCTPTSAQSLQSSLPEYVDASGVNITLIPKEINYDTPPLSQVPHTREVITGSDNPDSEDAIRTIVPVKEGNGSASYTYGGDTYGTAYAAGGSELGNREMVQCLTSPTYWDKAFGNWGKWVGPLYCPVGMWAVGARLRFEHEQYTDHWLSNSLGDDTAMNAFRLLCAPLGTFGETYQTVEPHAGYWGDWHKEAYCEKSLVVGFELRTERAAGRYKWYKRQGHLLKSKLQDRTAANSLRILCSNQKVIELPGGGVKWGEWTGQEKCPAGSAVCGAWAQVEAPGGRGKDRAGDTDYTGLNNIAMDCCKVDLMTCTPTDKWEVLWEFNNKADVAMDRTYSKTTGVTRTDEKEQGGSQEDQWKEDLMGEAGFSYKGLSAKFSKSVGTSAVTKTDWKETSTLSFTKSETETLKYTVPGKTCLRMRQVVGECGVNIVRTNKIELEQC